MYVIDIKHLKVLLVEDNTDNAELIKEQLNQIGVNDVEWAASYKSAVEIYDKHTFDVLLVDIVLGKNKRRGDDFVRYIRRKKMNTPVIYLTSHFEDKTYDEVKSTKPHSFMNKQFAPLELKQALELCLLTKSDSSSMKISANCIFVKVGEQYQNINLDDVLYFSSQARMTLIHTDNKVYTSSILMRELEEILATYGFVRSHRSFVINLKKISQLDLKSGELIIKDTIIPIGYFYRKHILEQLNILK